MRPVIGLPAASRPIPGGRCRREQSQHQPVALSTPRGMVRVQGALEPTDATVDDPRCGTELVLIVCWSGGRRTWAAEPLDHVGLDVHDVVVGTSARIRGGRPVETGAPRR